MGDSAWGTVKRTGFYDFRFLNPFEKLPNGSFFGNRGGNIQFIYLVCVLISLISIFLYSTNKSKLILQIFFLCISYFVMYYNISCLLIPNDHQRCYGVAWMFLLIIIMSTVLTIFGESLFKNINKLLTNKEKTIEGGSSCYKNKDKNKKNQNGGGKNYKNKYETHCQLGSYCYKDKHCLKGSQCYKELQYGRNYFLYSQLEDNVVEDNVVEDNIVEDNVVEDNIDQVHIAGACDSWETTKCGFNYIFQLYALQSPHLKTNPREHTFKLIPNDLNKKNVEYGDMFWITMKSKEATYHLSNCKGDDISFSNGDRTTYEYNSDKYNGSLFEIISPQKTTGKVMKDDKFILKLKNGKYMGKGAITKVGCSNDLDLKIKYGISVINDLNIKNHLWSLSTLIISSEKKQEDMPLKKTNSPINLIDESIKIIDYIFKKI